MQKGMHGVTGNYYTGLLDFEDMAFLLHFLRDSDLFFDIGANVGAYSILSGGFCQAQTIAIEPVPETFAKLSANIELNKIVDKVSLLNNGISDHVGSLTFSITNDTVNHVIKGNVENGVTIDVITIDQIAEASVPSIMKIDVEGYEWFVLNGAKSTLSNSGLKGIILELNGSGQRYGKHDSEIHEMLIKHSFQPYSYAPFDRTIALLDNYNTSNNTIYLRDLAFVNERVRNATSFKVFGNSI